MLSVVPCLKVGCITCSVLTLTFHRAIFYKVNYRVLTHVGIAHKCSLTECCNSCIAIINKYSAAGTDPQLITCIQI